MTKREREHAKRCVVRAIQLAVVASTEAEAERYVESALRFLRVVCREPMWLGEVKRG
jgi:hypothetical protein